jgi:hypothetical protein
LHSFTENHCTLAYAPAPAADVATKHLRCRLPLRDGLAVAVKA